MTNLTDGIKDLIKKDYSEESPRGLLVREFLLEKLELNPTEPFSEFETRKFNFKYFTGELIWYLCGDFSTGLISKFSTFWDKLVDKDGLINSNYGQIILKSPSQFSFAYNTLVKDKNSRQALIHINSPVYQFKETKDFPCTLNILFYIRKNELNMRVYMRSQDIFYGMQYDVPWFSVIHQNMFLLLKETYSELKLGKYYQMFDNVHYYERHFSLVEDIKNEKKSTYYTMELLKPIIKIGTSEHTSIVDNFWLNEYYKFKNDIIDFKEWKQQDWIDYLNNTGFFKIEKKQKKK